MTKDFLCTMVEESWKEKNLIDKRAQMEYMSATRVYTLSVVK